jgi:hypothetical protein
MPKQVDKASKAKTKSKAKPKKKVITTKPLPWMTIDEYLKRAEKLTGSKQLVIQHELEPELESGKRRSQRRNITTGLTEELGRVFWRGHLIDISIGSVQIYRAKPNDKDDPQRWRFFAHHPNDHVGGYVYYVLDDVENRGRDPKFSNQQLAELQTAYRAYKTANPRFKKDDANTHLQDYAKTNFKKTAHADTIRDRVMTPVDDADAVEK